MLNYKPTQIKTPWNQINELLNGGGFNSRVAVWFKVVEK